MLDQVKQRYGADLTGRTFGVWGLSFKPGTDDVREAPALTIVRGLLEAGATVRAFDPVAGSLFEKQLVNDIGRNKRFQLADDKYAALNDADALVLITEWKEFRSPDFTEDSYAAEAAGDLRRPQSVRCRAIARRGLELHRRRPREH